MENHRQTIDSLPFGIYEEILLGKDLLLKAILKVFFFFITYLMPVVVLLSFWYRFADYHDFKVSSYHLILAFISFVVAFYFVSIKKALKPLTEANVYLKAKEFVKNITSEEYLQIFSKLLNWIVYYFIPLTFVGLFAWAFVYPYQLIIGEVSKSTGEIINEEFIKEKENFIEDKLRLLIVRFRGLEDYLKRPILNVSGEILIKGVNKETLEVLREFEKGDKPLLYYVPRTDYSERNFSFAKLREVILINSDLEETNLYRADLKEAKLARVDLREANLSGASLREADLSDASLIEINLSKANLEEANLSGANLREADLSEAFLKETNLSGVSLEEANLSGASLWEVNLFGTNLIEVNFSEAFLVEVNLSRSSLREANLSSAYLEEVNLSKADLRGANLYKARLKEVNFSKAALVKANLSRGYLGETNFSGADLSGANLVRAELRQTNLSGVNLTGANLSGAYLIEVDLSGAFLKHTSLSGSYIEDVDFLGTILEKVKLNGACGNKSFLSTSSFVYCNDPIIKRINKSASLNGVKKRTLTKEKIKKIVNLWRILPVKEDGSGLFKTWLNLLYRYENKSTLEWIRAQDVSLGKFTEENLREFLRALILGLNKDDFLIEFRLYVEFLIRNNELSRNEVLTFIKDYVEKEKEIIKNEGQGRYSFDFSFRKQALQLLNEIEKELLKEYSLVN